MKVLHLIFSRQVAGAEKYLLDLLPGLKNFNIDCELICVIPKKDQYKFEWYSKKLRNDGIKTTIFTESEFTLFSAASKIARYLRENKIYYLHSHLLKADLLSVITKMFFKRKIFLISTRHGYQEKYLEHYQRHKGKPFRNFYYYLSKFICKRINTHIAISKSISDLYYQLRLTEQLIPYIHHGITIKYNENALAGVRHSSPQLVIAGRIEKIKGHKYLFDAMPAVINKFPEAKLLVLGNGTEKENLEKQAKDLKMEKNVEFLGFQKNPYQYIANSDIIVLPSLYEPFGLVYIEAFALKTPVIAFNVPACNEIITDNKNGMLVPVADSKALARSIIFLLNNPEKRNEIVNTAYQLYRDYYQSSRMVSDTAKFYQSLEKLS